MPTPTEHPRSSPRRALSSPPRPPRHTCAPPSFLRRQEPKRPPAPRTHRDIATARLSCSIPPPSALSVIPAPRRGYLAEHSTAPRIDPDRRTPTTPTYQDLPNLTTPTPPTRYIPHLNSRNRKDPRTSTTPLRNPGHTPKSPNRTPVPLHSQHADTNRAPSLITPARPLVTSAPPSSYLRPPVIPAQAGTQATSSAPYAPRHCDGPPELLHTAPERPLRHTRAPPRVSRRAQHSAPNRPRPPNTYHPPHPPTPLDLPRPTKPDHAKPPDQIQPPPRPPRPERSPNTDHPPHPPPRQLTVAYQDLPNLTKPDHAEPHPTR